ncbi:endonuclease VII domain-containing protein [Stenotrophomonas cyclobalanopsidis]|uniref:endonuclease VII domain-containing protein n=1 Tax=Stenotrophomonas cyclobalanopsidis TaxID=2771362 RepID=UPI002FDAF62F
MKICTKCKVEKSEGEFWADRRRSSGLMARCKSCKTGDARDYRAARPGYHKAVYAKTRTATRERHLVRKYGVTLADYGSMLHEQDGKCAICSAPEAEQFKGVFHVDHCHTTGKVRGLLCRGCNHMLGVVADDVHKLLRAITYLKGPQVAAEVIGAYMDCYPDPAEQPRAALATD